MASTSYGAQRRPPQRPQADQHEPAAGRWVDGQFTFATPEAEEAWQRSAYQQAVNAKTWHLGDKIDDQTRNAILAGIGGATRPMYQGPDGQYYFQNARTLEDPSARSHRAKHVAGKTIDQIAAAGKIPGEDEYVAMRRAPQHKPVNDNQRINTLRARNVVENSQYSKTPQEAVNTNSKHPSELPENRLGSLRVQNDRLLMPKTELGSAKVLAKTDKINEPMGLLDWLFKGPIGPDTPEPGGCPQPDCDAVHKACSAKCLQLYTGRGFRSDTPLLYRRCVRECMADSGCYNY